MTVTPFADQERELLIEMAYLFAHRDERERAMTMRLEGGAAAVEKQHTAAIGLARQTYETALAAAVAEHEAKRTASEAEHTAKVESAGRWMKSDISAFRQRTQSMLRTIESKRSETEWLADAMEESGQARINPAFEAARKSVAQRSAEFDALDQTVLAALARAGHAVSPPHHAARTPGAATDGEPAKTLDDFTEAVRTRAAFVLRVVNPVWLTPLSVLGFVLLGAVTGAAIGGGKGWEHPLRAWPMGLKGAGIGAAAMLALMLLCRVLARRRVPRAAGAFSDAMAQARAAAARSLRAAEESRDARVAELAAATERERAGSRASAAVLEAEIERRTTTLEPELRRKHEKIIERVTADRASALAAIDQELAVRREAIESEHARAVREADETRSPVARALEESNRTDRAALEQEWGTRLAGAIARIDALNAAADEISPAWDSPRWEAPTPAAATPAGVRCGTLHLDLAALPGGISADPRLAVPGSSVRELPVMIDLLGRGSVLIRAGAEQRAIAISSLNAMALRLLTALPPGKVRFTFVDPVGLGQSFAGLMHISDYEEAIVGERIWTDARHIEQRLSDLTEHMETVIQKYLRNEYQTIQAYNAEAGEVAEPYRFLVIADFPAAMTEVAARKLASIVSSGARCGVFTLIAAPAAASGKGAVQSGPPIPWADLERHSMVLNITAAGTRWAREPFAPWPVELEAPPDEGVTTRLLHRVGEMVKDSTLVRVPFSLVAPEPGREWTADATSEVRLPLGRAGAKKVQHLSLGRGTAQHALVAGRTGSGKSTLLHVITTTAALWYSPDEVELYLVDFKKGVEFKTYATHRLPHARVIAVESEREFGVSVLRRLDAELTRRGTLFRDAGVQDVASFRRNAGTSGVPMPRILFIVDEFQEFFVEDDRLSQDAALLLDRLVRQGRAFGVHVILGSQTLGGAYSLARATLGQMAVRIALQCSESDAMLIMSEDNPAARLLSRPGEAIYNDTSGTIEGNSPFQIVWLPDEARDEQLDRVARHHAASGRAAGAPIVFEGHVPADIVSNPLLAEQISRRATSRAVPTLWLGEPLAIKEPTGIALRAQTAASALIVGNNEEQGAAMVCSALLALATWARCAPDQAGLEAGAPLVTILDATPPDLSHADLLPGVARAMGARLAGVREVRDALATLAAEVDRREASGNASHAPALLVVFGLHRFRDLRRADDFAFSTDADKPEPAAAVFSRVLRSGPSVGVHTLVWCDTASNADRALERTALREFNTRVLMQMSAGDSTQLIDGPQASTLGSHRALLFSDDTGIIEKFRPYALPDRAWLTGVLERLRE